MNPLISIIVPVYNTAEYVEECIQSILSQSYKNIELILVNDGSTDGSGEICKRYGNLPNVQYIEKENAGVVDARKRGVESANGEWIMFVDSDDYLLKDGIRELLSVADGVDIVVGNHTKSKKLINAYEYYDSEEYLFMLYCHRLPTYPWAKLFRTELFRKCQQAFAYNYPPKEDFLMNLVLAKTNEKKISIWKKPVYFYRFRMESASHGHSFDLDYLHCICNIANNVVADGLSQDKKRQAGIETRMKYYKVYLKQNDFRGNKRHPFVKEIIRLMNKDRAIRISDRLLLSVSNKRDYKIYLFLNKFIIRIKKPSLIMKDIKRLYK